MDSAVEADNTARKRAISRQRASDLVAVHMRLPKEIVEAARTCAAARGVSMAAVLAEAARRYLDTTARAGSEDSRDALIARHLSRVMLKLRTTNSQQRLMLETLGVMGQLLLGSLPMPTTAQEQQRYDEQVARRYPKFIEAIAKSVSRPEGQFLRLLPLDVIAAREDFPEPPGTTGGANKESPT
jgi:hypothetical protein